MLSPTFTKEALYESCVKQFRHIYTTEECVSPSYFEETWKSHPNHVKVRKGARFTKYSTCEQMWASIRDAFNEVRPTKEYISQRDAHTTFVASEGRGYRGKTELGNTKPSNHVSLVVGGAENYKFAFRNFRSSMNG